LRTVSLHEFPFRKQAKSTVIAHILQPGSETSDDFSGVSNYREISMCSQRLDGGLLVHLALNCRVECRLHGRFPKARK
jgi:hypothetical protein